MPSHDSSPLSPHREKMICRMLLLLSLTCCVYGMSEPLKFQAEEDNNVTVEWSFSSKANISISSLKLHCLTVLGLKVFYHMDHHVYESQNQQFAGRVQCDREALRTGSVRLHLSRVRADDSGQYLCRMATGSGRKVKQFSLNITAAVDEPTTVTPTAMIPAAAASRRRSCFYVVLGLTAASAVAVLAYCRCTSSYTALHTQKKESPHEV
ncbi:uncharacterized protein LOC115023561 [Cottoperca gobio]|uniref:Uncharacterized protein LOC115023561 n=1 Tax=Cottoperca gobio TaxID=56716 RepID=A0A6J2RHY3_COTGO|nr:uncharacterized protein LOC115023561 [Cottoperca gobio]